MSFVGLLPQFIYMTSIWKEKVRMVKKESRLKSKRLLLMGSSAFNSELPAEVKARIDYAMAGKRKIIVGEAPGACRLYQDYLKLEGYRNVIVGHAVRSRYNAGNWKHLKYGKDMKERERNMIEDCDSAIAFWMDNSSVISENLELLKRLKKPTYLYEYSSETSFARGGELDPIRTYDAFIS